MKSYAQYCGLAKALDVVGDRWTLLIVRELLLHGPSRYGDLQHGLPGIATNLLAERLRDLVQAGVVTRQEPVPPIATATFALTEWGLQLRPIVLALGAWAGRLLAKPAPGDRFRSHWLALPLEHFLIDRKPGHRRVRIELRTGDQPVTLETADGRVRVRPGPADDPDAVLTGPPDLILGVLTGRIGLSAARTRRLGFEGSRSALDRIGRRPDKAGTGAFVAREYPAP